jgi:prepilin-type N-terminal cleavage/methylation domain-containing protein
MQWRERPSPGFTIVELLVVIVVIAILAAISTVAYRGLQERARASEVSSALAQAKKKLEVYKVDTGTYPTSGNLASAGVTINDGSFQYTSDGSTFCLTATSGSVSYTATNTTSPTQGGCAGHGQGGIAAITNIAPNPGLETNTTGWSSVWGNSGAGSGLRTTSVFHSGSAAHRMTWSSAPTAATSGIWSAIRVDTPSAGGQTYTASMYIRTSWNGASYRMEPIPYDASNTFLGSVGAGSITAMSANTWTRIMHTFTAPANTAKFDLRARYVSGTFPSIGSTFDSDSVMLTEGDTVHDFADGNSPNWIWNGTPNNSSSTGPSL